MEIIVCVFTFLTIVFFILALIYTLKRDKLIVNERLHNYTRNEEQRYLPPELKKPFRERIVKHIIQSGTRIFGKIISQNKKEECAKKLMTAGNPYGLTAENFLIIKYFLIFTAMLIGLLIHNVGSFVCLFLAGVFIPDLFLKSKEKKRKNLILKSLPDVLDLLSVSVEAGLSFDASLQKIREKFSGPLSEEFDKTLQEINMGKPRRDALRDMGSRIDIDDINTFLGSVIQADQIGISIANVLRIQSGQVRVNRKMKAEEKAQKAPVKILIPLCMFVFPTILIVLLGPALIQIASRLK